MHTLYGDGIHDDYPAIQEMLDSGSCEVSLPAPTKNYLISQTLIVPSCCRLILPRFAHIKLADGANCCMVRNKTRVAREERMHPEVYERENTDIGKINVERYNFFVNEYSADPEDTAYNIEINGGIWDCNNNGQNPNPLQSKIYEPYGFGGYGMIFYNARNITLKNFTVKDPTTYAVLLDRVAYFSVKDITFDFNYGNPVPLNMDGIHLNGNCHFGRIENLQGRCFDDLVALNADEGSFGPISNISISNCFAEDCHSAVRLLTVKNIVENINISNIYGTYYQYCIGLTKYYRGSLEGYFDGITLENIYASKANRGFVGKIVGGNWAKKAPFPMIYIQQNTFTKAIKISEMHRREKANSVETVFVGDGAVVDHMVMDNIIVENLTSEEMSFMKNDGLIKHLNCSNIKQDGNFCVGSGVIEIIK